MKNKNRKSSGDACGDGERKNRKKKRETMVPWFGSEGLTRIGEI
ncbi:hypothetical protein A2U01_0032716, partial [Trifolium medium]|nr:hypothetical protein [Trifolium medium]